MSNYGACPGGEATKLTAKPMWWYAPDEYNHYTVHKNFAVLKLCRATGGDALSCCKEVTEQTLKQNL